VKKKITIGKTTDGENYSAILMFHAIEIKTFTVLGCVLEMSKGGL
jgi:hypothetical protein